VAAAVGTVCLAAAPSAAAHGFGQRYELPLPLSLYVFGAAAVVALSFVVFGLFVRGAHGPRARRGRDLLATHPGRMLACPAIIASVRLAGLALFIVTVLGGLIGNQNPYQNIAPTVVWIIWWVGLAYIAAFVGDLWRLINPWSTLFDAADHLCRRFGGSAELSLRLPYPPKLDIWPACLLLLAFTWIELIYPNSAAPAHIAYLAMAYSLLTWAGMLAYGRDTWLQKAEVFTLVFSTFARFAPTEARVGELRVRPFGSGLLDARTVSTSMMAFVLLLFAAVLYDGLIGTGEWAMLENAVRPLSPLPASWTDVVLKTAGLPIFWLLFLAAYVGVSALMSALAAGRPGALEIARHFALTLVPIVIGYHVAHYLVFLLVQGQYIISLLSDPFGFGWDLFGTAGYRVDIGLIGARFAWYAAVGSLVIGHVGAVYLAHIKAMVLFDVPGVALRTLAPLTALMVVYTVLGLSITAEPIVESRAAAEPSAVVSDTVVVPPDAVIPSAPDGRLVTLGPGKTAKVKLTYKVLGSAFHDTTKTTIADLLYAYAFAYRWSVRGGESDRYDPFIFAATTLLRRHLVAVRPVGVDTGSKSFRVGDVNFVREVFTIEVYLDIAQDDPDWNALVAPPWSTMPWHVLVLMEEAATRGWAAFSQAEAERRGIPWLDLVRSGEMSIKLASLATKFERDAFRPQTLHPHVTEEEARRRWAALVAFYKASGHFLVTNGPYRLKNWNLQSITLEAFRDLTYPLGVGSYDAYAIPRRGFITKVDWNGERLTLAGDIEITEKFQRSHRLVRTPLKSVPAQLLKRAAPECRYVVTGLDGRVAMAGVAPLGADANFQIDLKHRLLPGRFTLSALIAVNGNVMNVEVHRTQFVIGSRH
jgi:hypothetical protein